MLCCSICNCMFCCHPLHFYVFLYEYTCAIELNGEFSEQKRYIGVVLAWWTSSLSKSTLFSLRPQQTVLLFECHMLFFSDATTHLFKRLFPSVGPSVRPSVRPSVGLYVPCYFRTAKNIISYVPMTTKFDMDQESVKDS